MAIFYEYDVFFFLISLDLSEFANLATFCKVILSIEKDAKTAHIFQGLKEGSNLKSLNLH